MYVMIEDIVWFLVRCAGELTWGPWLLCRFALSGAKAFKACMRRDFTLMSRHGFIYIFRTCQVRQMPLSNNWLLGICSDETGVCHYACNRHGADVFT